LNNVIADPHPSYNEKVLGFGRISQVVLAVDGGSGPLDPPASEAPATTGRGIPSWDF